MMDLSDGLTKDLARLCDASGVGARVDLGAVPVSGPLASGAALLGVDARSLALSGGEDYELLVTMPADGVGRARAELQTGFGVDLSELGEVTEGSGLIGVDAEGRETVLEAAGWDHFAGG